MMEKQNEDGEKDLDSHAESGPDDVANGVTETGDKEAQENEDEEKEQEAGTASGTAEDEGQGMEGNAEHTAHVNGVAQEKEETEVGDDGQEAERVLDGTDREREEAAAEAGLGDGGQDAEKRPGGKGNGRKKATGKENVGKKGGALDTMGKPCKRKANDAKSAGAKKRTKKVCV